TSVTGVLAKGGQQPGIQRVERPPGELLGLGPERADVGHDGGASLAVAECVDAAGPVRERQAIVLEHPVEEHDPEPAWGAHASSLPPVSPHQDTAQAAHVQSPVPETAHAWAAANLRPAASSVAPVSRPIRALPASLQSLVFARQINTRPPGRDTRLP